jgi:hypothetical protein
MNCVPRDSILPSSPAAHLVWIPVFHTFWLLFQEQYQDARWTESFPCLKSRGPVSFGPGKLHAYEEATGLNKLLARAKVRR